MAFGKVSLHFNGPASTLLNPTAVMTPNDTHIALTGVQDGTSVLYKRGEGSRSKPSERRLRGGESDCVFVHARGCTHAIVTVKDAVGLLSPLPVFIKTEFYEPPC